MPGYVTVPMNEKDVNRLIDHVECSRLSCTFDREDTQLLQRLRGYASALACQATCATGACQVPKPGTEESQTDPVQMLDCIGNSCGRPTL